MPTHEKNEISGKSHNSIELLPIPLPSPGKENFVSTSINLLTNRN